MSAMALTRSPVKSHRWMKTPAPKDGAAHLDRRVVAAAVGNDSVSSREEAIVMGRGEEDEKDKEVLLAVLCGGPTAERGISLNSARSVLDHLRSPGVRVECYYLDQGLRAFPISVRQIYSNTPSDFDFKLRNGDSDGSVGPSLRDPESLAVHLRDRGAIAFPALHGAFGEDGTLQAALEAAGVPFVGTGSVNAARAFDKHTCTTTLAVEGFPTLPMMLLLASDPCDTYECAVRAWFDAQGLDSGPGGGCVVVKPARGGSSIGVNVVKGAARAAECAAEIITSGLDTRVVVERFAGNGREFTIIVLETRDGPVPLIPTEVEILATTDGGNEARREGITFGDGEFDSEDDASPSEQRNIFNFRRKYLPTMQVAYHTPARFGTMAVEKIRTEAAEVFKVLGLRDFARLDGFFMPQGDVAVEWRTRTMTQDRIASTTQGHTGSDLVVAPGFPVFTDVNIISGMEQTSFVFLQAAEVGLSHSAVLMHVLKSACERANIAFPSPASFATSEMSDDNEIADDSGSGRGVVPLQAVPISGGSLCEHEYRQRRRIRIYVLFGGGTSERQVSLISGTNVWLKLRALQEFDVSPVLLTPTSEGCELGSTTVWHLPYAAVLRHTVEEILAVATASPETVSRLMTEKVRATLLASGWVTDGEAGDADFGRARSTTLQSMALEAAEEGAVVFNAVHGGCGEDGSLQALLTGAGVTFTGSGTAASRLCIDKAATGSALASLSSIGVLSCRKRVIPTTVLFAVRDNIETAVAAWNDLVTAVGPASAGLCIKPNADGCSTGVARLRGPADLLAYAFAIAGGKSRLNPGDLPLAIGNLNSIVELPRPTPDAFLIEPFIATGAVRIQRHASGAETLSFDEGASSDALSSSSSRWVEVTVGVVGSKGRMVALNPSLTVVEGGDILSLEEKFQGGTGVNITPLPPSIIAPDALEAARKRIAATANALEIEGFARIDAFLHVDTGEVMIIEANTVPGMTPSTVLFHQALMMDPPVEPAEFLANAVHLALERTARLRMSSKV